MRDCHLALLGVLQDASLLLGLPGNNFLGSTWEDASAALAEAKHLSDTIEKGELPDKSEVIGLFAPTGRMQ